MLAGAVDSEETVQNPVSESRLVIVRQRIVNLFSLAAAGDHVVQAKNLQVVGDGGIAHSHSGGDIADTFLGVA